MHLLLAVFALVLSVASAASADAPAQLRTKRDGLVVRGKSASAQGQMQDALKQG